MKSKIIITLTIILLLFALTACTKSSAKEKETSNETSEIENTINEKIEKIVNNGPHTSSNPFDYINESKEIYDELLNTPKNTFNFCIKDLIKTNARNGLKSYIEAVLCNEINDNLEIDFETASHFLTQYEKKLFECDCLYNEYDEYAIEQFNNEKKRTFVRTYNVLDLTEETNESYLYITIKQFQGEEVQTVKIRKDLLPNISKDKNYEFTLKIKTPPEENILSIFENCEVIKIEETNKTGLDQKQETIPKVKEEQ